MQVHVKWSGPAKRQYAQLDPAQQESANNAVRAIGLSPEAGSIYQSLPRGSSVEHVFALFGMLVVVLYRKKFLGSDIEVKIQAVRPSDLRSQTEYEEGEEGRRSRPPYRGRGPKAGPEDW